ncbi:TRAP transporter small permease [Jeotgalibacillus soli]|uniref:TRAP transporter small permease n=1 Tax=Jeotgalibacillus soli TaxID=889306 RepID=UPI000597E56D|nr:TRAP transporter small permease [Jeotgalibacillus soli]
MNRVSNLINGISIKFITILGIVMTLTIIAQVICRTFLGFSIYWSEELARYCLIWITFIGAAIAYRNADLAVLDLLDQKISGKSKWIYKLIIQLIVANFIFVCIYYGFKQATSPSTVNVVSPALRLPMQYIYLSVPVAFSIMFIHWIRSVIEIITNRKGKGEKCQLS